MSLSFCLPSITCSNNPPRQETSMLEDDADFVHLIVSDSDCTRHKSLKQLRITRLRTHAPSALENGRIMRDIFVRAKTTSLVAQ